MKVYGLIGRSLGHSFSKKYFSDKFEAERIVNCQYRNFELEDLKTEIPPLKCDVSIAGLNVTIPYKTDIIPFLDETSPAVNRINACNCIQITRGRWKGFNTDVTGFERSFAPHLKLGQKNALVLGTGGASKAVAYVLERLDIDFLKVSRTERKKGAVIGYEEIDANVLRDFQIVINTTPAGTFPEVDDCPPLPYEAITPNHYFFDLVYNPPKTRFLANAENKGATIENGAAMLAIQAEESWRIWNVKGPR